MGNFELTWCNLMSTHFLHQTLTIITICVHQCKVKLLLHNKAKNLPMWEDSDISPNWLLYIFAIYLILVYGPWYLHAWKSLIYDKEQWSLWLPDHLIMPRQWSKCVALFDIGNGEVLAKLARLKLTNVCSNWAFSFPCLSSWN
jgi:hypothetical protein